MYHCAPFSRRILHTLPLRLPSPFRRRRPSLSVASKVLHNHDDSSPRPRFCALLEQNSLPCWSVSSSPPSRDDRRSIPLFVRRWSLSVPLHHEGKRHFERGRGDFRIVCKVCSSVGRLYTGQQREASLAPPDRVFTLDIKQTCFISRKQSPASVGQTQKRLKWHMKHPLWNKSGEKNAPSLSNQALVFAAARRRLSPREENEKAR